MFVPSPFRVAARERVFCLSPVPSISRLTARLRGVGFRDLYSVMRSIPNYCENAIAKCCVLAFFEQKKSPRFGKTLPDEGIRGGVNLFSFVALVLFGRGTSQPTKHGEALQ